MKFYRIITTDITSKSKLKLPDKFVKRHGSNMSANVTLIVPTGVKWRVDLKKMKDGFWFGKGLFEFTENLNLKYGYFLMFDYVDVDVFHVVVIDFSAVEIQYPTALTIFDFGQHLHQEKCKHPKLEQVEDGPLKSYEAPAPLHKYIRKMAKGCEMRHIETDHTATTKGTFGREIILNNEQKIQCVIQGRRWKQNSKEKLITIAKGFKAKEPACIIAMQPSYVCETPSIGAPLKCQLLFPYCFIKEYFNLSNKYVMFEINNGRIWSVEYRLVKHKQAFLTYGWKQFVMDNCLRSGDVCLFELIKEVENGMKVVIFRSVEEHQELN